MHSDYRKMPGVLSGVIYTEEVLSLWVLVSGLLKDKKSGLGLDMLSLGFGLDEKVMVLSMKYWSRKKSLDTLKTLINYNTHFLISYICNCKISIFT